MKATPIPAERKAQKMLATIREMFRDEIAILPGEGYRFLRGKELPAADDEFMRHDMKHNEGWIKCGKDFNFLSAEKLQKIGIVVRRAK